MPAPALLPDDATLRRLRHDHTVPDCPLRTFDNCQGTPHSYKAISDYYGVTPGALYQRLSKMGEIKPRARHLDLIPWRVSKEHIHGYPAQMLRLLSRRIKGQSNPASKDRLLDAWLRDMEESGAVVAYDPAMGPNAASPEHGGWHYLRRTADDGPFDPATGSGVIRRPA